MSSIDKYVRSTATECNPNVRVVTRNGRIEGYIGNDKVFDIADRYGYLSPGEETIIKDSIRAYERQNEERNRLNAVQLENQRVAARTELKKNISSVRSAIYESYKSAKNLHSRAVESIEHSLTSKLSKLVAYDVSAYRERVQGIEQRLNECERSISAEYNARVAEINAFESSVRDDASTEEFISKRGELRYIRTNVATSTLPINEVQNLNRELEELAKSLEKVKEIENELKKIPKGGMSGSIAENAINRIHSKKISSLSDVTSLMAMLEEQLIEIQKVEFQSQTSEAANRISVLEGLIKSCSQLRTYIVEQYYEAKSYRGEVIEAANDVINVYSELRVSEYTTCSSERISEILTVVQEVLNGEQNDEETLKMLHGLLDEGEAYRRDDDLQADNYADYKRKVAELTERGYSYDELEAFDPLAYEEQKSRLINLLIEQDIDIVRNRTRLNFFTMCETMEKMGYRPLYCNMGSEEKGDDMACEAIYVIPGCEGAVFKIVASDDGIHRKIVGVQRPSGLSTTVERVREVAMRIEESDEINDCFTGYADAIGDEVMVESGIDTWSENSDEVIRANGCFVLSEEGEKLYDDILASSSEEEKAKWKTGLVASASTTVLVANESVNEREEESRACYERIHKARKN